MTDSSAIVVGVPSATIAIGAVHMSPGGVSEVAVLSDTATIGARGVVIGIVAVERGRRLRSRSYCTIST
jgi:hypothetical protein